MAVFSGYDSDYYSPNQDLSPSGPCPCEQHQKHELQQQYGVDLQHAVEKMVKLNQENFDLRLHCYHLKEKLDKLDKSQSRSSELDTSHLAYWEEKTGQLRRELSEQRDKINEMSTDREALMMENSQLRDLVHNWEQHQSLPGLFQFAPSSSTPSSNPHVAPASGGSDSIGTKGATPVGSGSCSTGQPPSSLRRLRDSSSQTVGATPPGLSGTGDHNSPPGPPLTLADLADTTSLGIGSSDFPTPHQQRQQQLLHLQPSTATAAQTLRDLLGRVLANQEALSVALAVANTGSNNQYPRSDTGSESEDNCDNEEVETSGETVLRKQVADVKSAARLLCSQLMELFGDPINKLGTKPIDYSSTATRPSRTEACIQTAALQQLPEVQELLEQLASQRARVEQLEDNTAQKVDALANERAYELARDLAKDLAKEWAEALAVERAEAIAVKRAEALALEKAEVLARDRAEAIARERAESLAEERAEVLARRRADVLARKMAEILAKDMAEALAREKAEVIVKERTEVLVKERAELLARKIADSIAADKAEVLARKMVETVAKERAEILAKEKADALVRETGALKERTERQMQRLRSELETWRSLAERWKQEASQVEGVKSAETRRLATERDQLAYTCQQLRQQLSSMQKQLDAWQADYFALESAGRAMKLEAERLRARLAVHVDADGAAAASSAAAADAAEAENERLKAELLSATAEALSSREEAHRLQAKLATASTQCEALQVQLDRTLTAEAAASRLLTAMEKLSCRLDSVTSVAAAISDVPRGTTNRRPAAASSPFCHGQRRSTGRVAVGSPASPVSQDSGLSPGGAGCVTNGDASSSTSSSSTSSSVSFICSPFAAVEADVEAASGATSALVQLRAGLMAVVAETDLLVRRLRCACSTSTAPATTAAAATAAKTEPQQTTVTKETVDPVFSEYYRLPDTLGRLRHTICCNSENPADKRARLRTQFRLHCVGHLEDLELLKRQSRECLAELASALTRVENRLLHYSSLTVLERAQSVDHGVLKSLRRELTGLQYYAEQRCRLLDRFKVKELPTVRTGDAGEVVRCAHCSHSRCRCCCFLLRSRQQQQQPPPYQVPQTV